MVKKFLNFDTFITPLVIKILYFVLVALVILGGIAQMFVGFNMMGYSFGGGLMMVIGSIIGALIGIVFVRVSVEGVIAFFQIRDALVDGKVRTNTQSADE